MSKHYFLTLEGPCTEALVLVPQMPCCCENVVQLQSVWSALLVKSKVRFSHTVRVENLEVFFLFRLFRGWLQNPKIRTLEFGSSTA